LLKAIEIPGQSESVHAGEPDVAYDNVIGFVSGKRYGFQGAPDRVDQEASHHEDFPYGVTHVLVVFDDKNPEFG
jgi:hypothetical protein